MKLLIFLLGNHFSDTNNEEYIEKVVEKWSVLFLWVFVLFF